MQRKRIIKVVSWSIVQLLTALLSLSVLYLIFAMIGMLIPYKGVEQNSEIDIYVRSNGLHTDICVPVRSKVYDWTSYIDTTDYPFNERFQYIAFGWGDQGFYVETESWDDLKTANVVTALFVPSNCVMHVEYLDVTPKKSDHCALISISKASYSALINYIHRSFKLSDQQAEMITDVSYFGTDHFYAAKGSYHLFENCNSWANGALKSAGVRTASWAIFSKTILSYQQ